MSFENVNKKKDNKGKPDFDAVLKPEEVILQITTYEASQNPSYRLIHNAYLKDGPRAYKVAVMYEVINKHTREFHHFVLDIISLTKLKRGWYFTYEEKFTLSGQNGEIDVLYKFLSVFYMGIAPNEAGEYFVLTKSEELNHKLFISS